MVDAPVLVFLTGPRTGEHVVIDESGLTLGRSADNQLVIEDDDVSRFHAALQYDNGSLWLRDVGSRNGVYVNDKRLGGHKDLRAGDVVRMGNTEFEVRWRSELKSSAKADDDEKKKKGGWFGLFER